MQVGYRQKLRFLTSISLHCVLSTLRPSGVNTVPLIAGSSKRRSLLTAGEDNKLFMTRSLNVAPKTTEQHLIVRSGKSEAEVRV